MQVDVNRRIWNKDSKCFKPAPKPLVRFLKGPIPWNWIEAVSGLGAGAILVGLCLWRNAGMSKTGSLRLTNASLDGVGINRMAKSRALHALEEAGLIRVERPPGCLPVVTLIALEMHPM